MKRFNGVRVLGELDASGNLTGYVVVADVTSESDKSSVYAVRFEGNRQECIAVAKALSSCYEDKASAPDADPATSIHSVMLEDAEYGIKDSQLFD